MMATLVLFLIGKGEDGRVVAKRKKYRPYSKARDHHVRGLGLTGKKDWREYCKSGELPPDIPGNPQDTYGRRGEWISWPDFLGTDNIRPQDMNLAPWPEARDIARGLGLKSQADWRRLCEDGKKPPRLPTYPEDRYKKTGEWTDWGDFLGTDYIHPRNIEWVTWPEAREFARGLGLKSKNDWNTFCNLGNKPHNIPRNPAHWYKKTGEWTSWPDFLGTDNIRPQDKTFAPWPEARKIARGLELKSYDEWVDLCKSGKRLPNLPVNPDLIYGKAGEWTNWPDFLGYTPTRWTRTTLLTLLEDLRPLIADLPEEDLYAILSEGGELSAMRKKLGGVAPLKVLKDLKENDGAEIEAALEASSDEAVEVDGDEDTELASEIDPTGADGDALKHELGALPAVLTPSSLRFIDKWSELRDGLEHETAEFLIESRVAKLWSLALNKGREAAVSRFEGEGGYYYNLIRSRFFAQLEAAESLEAPPGWAYKVDGVPVEPLLMQKRCAYLVREKKRVGNWSGTGAGKTVAGALASRVADRKHTLIICNNSTVKQWCDEIRAAFPDSVVRTGLDGPAEGRHVYTILNYEKFQISSRTALPSRLARYGIDFIILDEIQLAKQRDKRTVSYRSKSISALLSLLRDGDEELQIEGNEDLHVLGMSATPVINNLTEARKLLEMVTGKGFADLAPQATINNALAVYRALMTNGFRHLPNYDIKLHTVPLEAVRNDLRGELIEATSEGILAIEQALLPAKLERARPYFRPGTLVYSYYVDEMIGPIRDYLEKDLGLSVGRFVGNDKSGLEPFKAGRVDVLVGSQPVGTGLDGLQERCDQIVVLSPPWTSAEYQQLEGRIWRQGSAFDEFSMIIPQVVLEDNGDEWSWDHNRWEVIKYKRTLSDCAVDGRIPEAQAISRDALLEDSREALDEWIRRVQENGLQRIERERLMVPLPPELREKIRRRHGSWNDVHNRWVGENSSTVHDRLKDDPEEWYLYHDFYRKAREN